MELGDEIEVFGPYTEHFKQKIDVLLDDEDQPIQAAPHPQQIVKIRMEFPVSRNYMLRKFK